MILNDEKPTFQFSYTNTFYQLQSRKKYLELSKEIKQNRTGLKNFEICFFVIFGCYDQNLIFGRKTVY